MRMKSSPRFQACSSVAAFSESLLLHLKITQIPISAAPGGAEDNGSAGCPRCYQRGYRGAGRERLSLCRCQIESGHSGRVEDVFEAVLLGPGGCECALEAVDVD